MGAIVSGGHTEQGAGVLCFSEARCDMAVLLPSLRRWSILIMPWQLGKSRLSVFSDIPVGEWWGQGLNPGPGEP